MSKTVSLPEARSWLFPILIIINHYESLYSLKGFPTDFPEGNPNRPEKVVHRHGTRGSKWGTCRKACSDLGHFRDGKSQRHQEKWVDLGEDRGKSTGNYGI